jgi:uncharacterized membrane protein
MRHRIFYNPFTAFFTFFLFLLLSISVSVLFLGLVSSAFVKLFHFGWGYAFLLLFLCLVGSNINIPLTTLENEVPIPDRNFIRVFGVKYRIPFKESFVSKTTVAVNVGGAVIPTLVSVYLLYIYPEALIYCIYGILTVALIAKFVARPVKGVGIVTPALVPPLVAALSAVLIASQLPEHHEFAFIIAYTGGTLGTLIGADLLNLRGISKIGAPVVSIGGAGTFDGVFLAGIIAVLLVV